MFTRDITTSRLSDGAIRQIMKEHRRSYAGHEALEPAETDDTNMRVQNDPGGRTRAHAPALTRAYSPETGRYAGTPNAYVPDPRYRMELNQFVLVDDDCMPTADDLAAVKILEDGTLEDNWFRYRPPAPEPTPGPSDDAGVQLPDRVLEAMVKAHRDVMARLTAEDRPDGWDPVLPLAFSAADGKYVGSGLDPSNADHRHEMVMLTTHDLPTVEHLRRIRRHANGWISWADA